MPVTIKAEPESVSFDIPRTAFLIIDMQRDFLEPGGFGETLGNDVSLLGRAVGPTKAVLDAAREAGMLVIHTREGHRPDLSDAPKATKAVFDQLNEAGGINGCKIEYTIADDKADPQVAAQAARDLIDNKEVVVLGGGASLLDCAVNAGTYRPDLANFDADAVVTLADVYMDASATGGNGGAGGPGGTSGVGGNASGGGYCGTENCGGGLFGARGDVTTGTFTMLARGYAGWGSTGGSALGGDSSFVVGKTSFRDGSTIDNRNDAVDRHSIGDLRPVEGAHERLRQGQA